MCRLSILTVCLLSAHLTATAGPLSLFKKAPKPEPAQQVLSLLNTLKTDSREGNRQQAAEDLRNFDLQAFPEIMSGLINALDSDSSSSVRRETVQSIGKMRPVSSQAHEAIKRSSAKDELIRVRAEAKTVLLDWSIRRIQPSGQSVAQPTPSADRGEPPIRSMQTSRPPVAQPTQPAEPPIRSIQTSRPPVAQPTRTTQTGEPPIAEPMPAVAPQAMPVGPTKSAKPEIRPDGPSLNAPK